MVAMTSIDPIQAELTATRDRLAAIAAAADADAAAAEAELSRARGRAARARASLAAITELIDEPAGAAPPEPEDGDEDEPAAFWRNYDRDVTAAIERAERLRAERLANGNGYHPADAHVDRVNRLAESGALELPAEPDDATTHADESPCDLATNLGAWHTPLEWQRVTVAGLMAPIGPAGESVARTLRGLEIATVGDLAESLRDSLFEWADLAPGEARAIRDAVAIFAAERGWPEGVQHPDGIPTAWLVEDDAPAPSPDVAPAAADRRDPPAEGVPHARDEAPADPAADEGDEPLAYDSIAAAERAIRRAARRHARSDDEPIPTEIGPDEAPLPKTSDEALARALAEVRPALDALRQVGATDDAILAVLRDLPSERHSHPAGRGVSWGAVGGFAPGVWIGEEAHHWPDAGRGGLWGLHGPALVGAVRKLCRIPEPGEKTPRARKPRAADGEPLPAGEPAPEGFRRATRAEYRAAAADDRHERWRAVRDTGETVGATRLDTLYTHEETPAGAPVAAPGRADGCGPEYTDDELDRLLIHACRTYYPDLRTWWAQATEGGALDSAIRDLLVGRWPQGRAFVGADLTREKHGYTISRAGDNPCLWVGAFRGPGHRAALYGDELIARVRAVFGIPAPGTPSRGGLDLVTIPEKPAPPAGGLPLGDLAAATPRRYCGGDALVHGSRRKGGVHA